jgi:hypothetical protein
MERSQRGLSSFGILIVLAVVVALGYYTYKAISGEDEGPSCKSAFTACMQKCRRTSTEAPAAQACQESCQRDQAACERTGK